LGLWLAEIRAAWQQIAEAPFLDRSWTRPCLWDLPGCQILLPMTIDPHPPSPPGVLTRLEVFLLGRFAVAVDGALLAAERWPSLRATHLVQLLGLQPRQRMTRDEVIDAL
jgi:hypothetical protein